MKNFLFFIAVLFPVMILSCRQQGNNVQTNSQWRGENRDGIYNETGLLKIWPPDGPQLLWSYEGLGDGYSSVAISNEKIYLTGTHDDEDLLIYVLDLNGKLLDKKIVGKEMENNRYPGGRSTVCVNDGKLYIYTTLGQLFCLDDATLAEVWKRDILNEFDGRKIHWGLTESPLIVGDRVFITPGGKTNNMVAFDKNTGELIWSSPGEGKKSAYCSPMYIGGYSVPMVVTCTEQQIAAFNADSGEFLWSYPCKNVNYLNPVTPIYFDGKIFATSGYNGGSWLYRLTDDGKAAELLWHNEEMDNLMGGAIRIDNCIYGSGHEKNYWFCLDLETGEDKYKSREIGRSVTITADGMLYVYSERGKMYLVKPNPNELEIVSSFQVTLGSNQHWTHPVIYQGVLYIRHGDALMAYKI